MSTRVAVYEDGKKAEGKCSLSDAYAASRDNRAVAWVSLVEPSKEELLSVARQFGLQKLAEGDTGTRRGVVLDHRGRRSTLTVSPARYLDDPNTVEIGRLDVFLEEGLAITVSYGDGLKMHDVEQDLEENPDLSRLGAGAVLSALLYKVIDGYVSVVDGLGDDLADAEHDTFEGNGGMTKRLYELSREVAGFRPVAEHLEAVLDRLTDPDFQASRSNPELVKRLRGTRSRAQWINSMVSGFTGRLQNLLNFNLTLLSVQQNDQTRRVSAWAAIIAVPAVITGIYGMNFENMPELSWGLGYPFALLFMMAICVVLYVVFKRTGWL